MLEPRDPTIAYLQQKQTDAEDDLRDLLLERHFSEAVSELRQMPGWKQLVDRIASVMDGEAKRLLYRRMDEYTIGRVQGALRILRLVVETEPLSSEDLALLEQQATVAQDKLTEIRNLLE